MHPPFFFADKSLDLSQIQVMGVLNVTPDSFSDGGEFVSLDTAIAQTDLMIQSGATIIDVGGESTRPGAEAISLQQELDRVCPVVEQMCAQFDTIVSVDTSAPEVMSEAIRLGAGMINDVRAFSRDGAIDAVCDSSVALCVMHMKGDPESMQKGPVYHSVVDEVTSFLSKRAELLISSGVDKKRILLDPGFGFGKTLEHNLQLLNNIGLICRLGYPVLVGLSRKSMFGAILEKPVNERLYGSLAAATIAAFLGAKIIRVHDVEETKDAMRLVDVLDHSARHINEAVE